MRLPSLFFLKKALRFRENPKAECLTFLLITGCQTKDKTITTAIISGKTN